MADASLGQAVLRTKLDTSGLKAGFTQAKSETQKFSANATGAIRAIGTAFGTVAASRGVRAYISFLTSSANLAQQADASNRLFEKSLQRTNQSLSDGATLVQRLSDRFGVANSVIESSATLLLRQGASLNDIERALTAAGASAAAAGFDISTAFDNVATAVATGRSELLETSGIVTNLGPVTQQYAKALGKTVDELTEQEVIQARVNAIYKETASEIEDVDEILQGLPRSQANWTKELRTFRETAGDLGRDVLVPILDAGTGLLRMINDLPDPVIRAGTAMSGAAIGATALAAGIVTIKTALTGLGALGLGSFGPAGWIVLGVTAVAGLVAVLAGGRADSLDTAISKAKSALSSGSADSLTGALDAVIAKVDGPVKTSLEGLRDDLRTTGDVGVEMAERIAAALAQAATAPLQAELDTLRAEAEHIESLILNAKNPNEAQARLAEITNEGNRILDEGGEVPQSLIQEKLYLESVLEGLSVATQDLARDEARLTENRARQAELVREINSLSGPGVNVPAATPEAPPVAPNPNAPAGTPNDPVHVSLDDIRAVNEGRRDENEFPRTATGANIRARFRDNAPRFTTGDVEELNLLRRRAEDYQRQVTESFDLLFADSDGELARFKARGADYQAQIARIAQLGARPLVDPGFTAITPAAVDLAAPEVQAIVPAAVSLVAGLDAATAQLGDLSGSSIAELRQRIGDLEDLKETATSAEARGQIALLIQALQAELVEMMRRATPVALTAPGVSARFGLTDDDRAFNDGLFAFRPRTDNKDDLANAKKINQENDAAAERFQNTVISAGLSFAQSIERGIRTGDASQIVTGGIGAAGSIAAGLVGGPLGTIISGVIPIVTGIFGGLFGGNSQREEDERRRASENRRSQVSALEFNFNFNQSNTFSGELQQGRNAAALREAGLMSFRDFEQFMNRTILPQLNGLTAKVAALT